MASAPKPHIFQSPEEFRKEVGSHPNRMAFRQFFSCSYYDLNQLVRESVESNTFRAFHWKRKKIDDMPSKFYRNWALKLLQKTYPALLKCGTPEDYQDLLVESAKNLVVDWKKATDGHDEIRFGVAAKLLNLTFKSALRFRPKITKNDRERLSYILDIPLDSFTLQGVIKLCPELRIKGTATMRFVENECHYKELQKSIRDLCIDLVNLPPIYYEIRAWNMAH